MMIAAMMIAASPSASGGIDVKVAIVSMLINSAVDFPSVGYRHDKHDKKIISIFGHDAVIANPVGCRQCIRAHIAICVSPRLYPACADRGQRQGGTQPAKCVRSFSCEIGLNALLLKAQATPAVHRGRGAVAPDHDPRCPRCGARSLRRGKSPRPWPVLSTPPDDARSPAVDQFQAIEPPLLTRRQSFNVTGCPIFACARSPASSRGSAQPVWREVGITPA